MWSLPVSLLLGALIAGGIILGFLFRLALSERPRGVEADPSRPRSWLARPAPSPQNRSPSSCAICKR